MFGATTMDVWSIKRQLGTTNWKRYNPLQSNIAANKLDFANDKGLSIMAYEVRIEQSPATPLAVVRRLAAQSQLSKVVPEACGAVWNVIRAQQVPGAGRNVAVYLDCQINLEVGVEVATPFAGHGEVVGSSLPSGKVATATHLGPYGLLGGSHEAILKYCTSHGHALAGPSWEIYGHWQEAWNKDPSQIVTDVYYLLAES